MKRIKLVALLLVPMLVLGAFVLALSGLLPYKIYAVQTGSMSPTIPSASVVIVQPGVYKVGQAVTFVEGDGVITHRLMAIHPDGTIDTKGDANATIDPWHVPTTAIIGGVVASPAHLGYWLVFLKNPLGLLAIVLAALLCWQIWTFDAGETQSSKAPARRSRSRRSRGRRRAVRRRSGAQQPA